MRKTHCRESAVEARNYVQHTIKPRKIGIVESSLFEVAIQFRPSTSLFRRTKLRRTLDENCPGGNIFNAFMNSLKAKIHRLSKELPVKPSSRICGCWYTPADSISSSISHQMEWLPSILLSCITRLLPVRAMLLPLPLTQDISHGNRTSQN